MKKTMKKLDKILLLFWGMVFFIISFTGIFIEGTVIFCIKFFLRGNSRRKTMRILEDLSCLVEKSYLSLKTGIEKSYVFRREMEIV